MDATFDVALRTLTLSGDQPSNGCELSAKLNRYGQTIPLHGVSFGFTLTVDGVVVDERQWPPEGTHYVQTDQDVLASYRLQWSPGQSVELGVWLVDTLGETHTDSVSFTAPAVVPEPDPEPEPGGNESITPLQRAFIP